MRTLSALRSWFFSYALMLVCLISTASAEPLKVLHLTFHKGCAREIDALAKKYDLEVTTWFVPDLPPLFFDGSSSGNALYNIGHQRAEAVWNIHREFFNTFDFIITSDTAPLSRIFLQNNWKKPLIIWICNRFDYSDQESLDCDFPDPEYYGLFQQAARNPQVFMMAFTPFEHRYANSKGVDTGLLTITPCAPYIELEPCAHDLPPVLQPDRYFLPPYHNETQFMDLSSWCKKLGIDNYCGRYTTPYDLTSYKGIIHLPYSWSNFALFENLMLGIPYIIPSRKYFQELAAHENYFHPDLSTLLEENLFFLSEWYSIDHHPIFTFFDSWQDLIAKTGPDAVRPTCEQIKQHATKIQKSMFSRWGSIMNAIKHTLTQDPKTLFWGYPVTTYEDLDFGSLKLIKTAKDGTHHRALYFDPETKSYIKVWSSGYPAGYRFLDGLSFNFYAELSPLTRIVLDRSGECRGYVTHLCATDCLHLKTTPNNNGGQTLQVATMQNSSYQQLYSSLLQRSEETGLYYLDLTPQNIVADHDSYYLVDLECLTNRTQLRALEETSKSKYELILDHLPADYVSYLKSLTH